MLRVSGSVELSRIKLCMRKSRGKLFWFELTLGLISRGFELSGDDCNNIGRAGEQATRLHEVYRWLPFALIRVI